MRYTYEILKLEEIEELSSLLELIFKRDRLYYIEKTKQIFNNSRSCVIVAKYGGNIIASRGGFEWPLMINEKPLIALQSHNTGVHPSHRRKGVFSMLNSEHLKFAADNNIDYIFNVSVKGSRKGNEKLGWKYLNGFHRLTYFNKPYKVFKNIKDKSIPKRIKLDNSEKVEIINNSFLEARTTQFENLVYTNYTRDFIEWRLNNTEENYRVFKNDKVYAIYKIIQTDKMKSLVLGEFFLIENSRFLFRSALKEIMKLERPDITYTYISRNHPYFTHYLSSMFLPNPFNFNLNFGTRLISSDIEKDLSGKKWATSYLDIDTF